MQTINSNFILRFKLGDNVVYNLKIAKKLYECNEKCEDKLLNKPIILINVSIIEAIMHDFIEKIKILTIEGVNLPDVTINYIRDLQKTDKFQLLIDQFEKHNFVEVKGFNLIENLKKLSTIRNRIHIQNEKQKLERDDIDAFSKERLIISEKVLEIMMKVMSEKYPRNIEAVDKFSLPFREHFEELEYIALEAKSIVE